MISRAAVVLLAVAVAAWLALGLRNARLEQRGLELSQSGAAARTPALAREADRLLRDSETLNPDPTPTLYRGGLALRLGRPEQAVTLLRDVVSEEPENLDAWSLLATAATLARDQPLAREALLRTRLLSIQPTPAGD